MFKRAFLTLCVLTLGLLGLEESAFAKKEDSDKPNCPINALDFTEDLDEQAQTAADLHGYSLFDLADLAAKHPSIAMNAQQIAFAAVNVHGFTTVLDPATYNTKEVKMYHAFSNGLKETNGRRIHGHLGPLQEYVHWLGASAQGAGASSKMPLFVGPPGSGKSEFLLLNLALVKSMQTHDSRFYDFTYEWVNLSEVPELLPIVNKFDLKDGKEYELAIRSPIQESPITLLPTNAQKQIIQLASPLAKEIGNVTPSPMLEPNAFDGKIRDAIIKHYSQTLPKGAVPTPKQKIEWLDKHVRVVRRISGANGQQAKINAEGKDVDYNGLFTAPNPFVLSILGPTHPLSYNLNGKVLSGNRGFLFLDEFLRNNTELQDTFLEIMENRQVVRGGAPTITMDAVLAGASNLATLQKARDGEKNSARLDRMHLINTNYEVIPQTIAATILDMTGIKRVQQKKLLTKEELLNQLKFLENNPGEVQQLKTADLAPGNINDLYPMKNGATRAGPDGRYQIYVRGGSGDLIHISPHTLEYLSQVLSMSRIDVDPQKAVEKLPGAAIISTHEYRDPVTRLKVLMGDISLNGAERAELASLKTLVREGETGLSNRDAANIWLAQAIEEAEKPENYNVVTPTLLKRIFVEAMESGALKTPDNLTRIAWQNYADLVAENFLIPALASDITSALANGNRSIDDIYDVIVQELAAESADPDALSYSVAGGTERRIERDRLNKIKEIYKQNNRKTLQFADLSYFLVSTNGGANSREPKLMRAIETYFTMLSTNMNQFDDLAQALIKKMGSAPDLARATQLELYAYNVLGYCPHSLREALDVMRQKTFRKVVAKKNQ